MKSASALILTSVLGSASGHICVWNPLQRQRDGQTYDISTPGNTMCRNTEKDVCGGVPAGPVLTQLTAGEPYDITFQQNLNHFYVGNPGALIADFSRVPNPTEDDFTPLERLNDYNAMNEITQTNFTMRVRIPEDECEHCVLRMRYATQNPLEADFFYQCSDVSVKAGVTRTAASSPSLRGSSSSSEISATYGGTDCCAPSQFTMQAYETSSWRAPTHLTFYFDKEAQMQRIDTDSGSGSTIYDGHFQMYSNYSSGAEAYYNVATGECVVYGLDFWNDWCYGSVNNEEYETSVIIGNQISDVWRMPGSVFSWTNTRESCVPVALNRDDTGETTYYYSMVALAPPADVFTPPASCQAALAEASRLHPSRLPAAPFRHSNSNSVRRKYKV